MWNIGSHLLRHFTGNCSSYVQNPVVLLRRNINQSMLQGSISDHEKNKKLTNELFRSAEN